MGLFSLIFGDDNKKNIKQLTKIAEKVDALSEQFSKLTDDELKAMTPKLKQRYANGETLDDILPEAFATAREASWRVLSMKHFFVQIIGGIALHQGRIAEMKTGEGKTLVATLPAYLNALTGEGVHVVTVNEYLAKRDAEWMGKVYKFLGLTVGVVYPQMDPEVKRNAYKCDITYCTNNELGFDYLRDNMVVHKEDRVLRKLKFAIIDEVDSILIDEARTPLIISGRSHKSSDMYLRANRFVKGLYADDDYELDEKERTIRITEDGSRKAERYFGVENLTDVENTELNHYINQALRAVYVMKRENDYIVKDGEVIIVDEFTGRLMIGRRYSEGLHQAIEAKENVKIQSENKTLATITFQNFFRLYEKLSGMTGTAKTEEAEFNGIYGLDVVIIPTNLTMIRKDNTDSIFKTLNGKNMAIIRKIEECYASKQPILVGTISVEKSEELSKLLRLRRIPHHVLNAKNHEQEAFIVAQAGKYGAVTIATNMAGRGTDILLGGNPEYMAKSRLRELGYSDEQISEATSYVAILPPDIEELRKKYKELYEKYKVATDEEKVKVKALGGLFILGTERHESRRIDNQLRGRSGRQGDEGTSQFYISLEDDLAKFFGGEALKRVFNFMNVAEDEEITMKMVSRSIESAQKKIEGRNFAARKRVLEYDDVMNRQRFIMYSERDKVLANENVHKEICGFIDVLVDDVIDEAINRDDEPENWDIPHFNKLIEDYLLEKDTNFVTLEKADKLGITKLRQALIDATTETYEKKILKYKEVGIDFYDVERVMLLRFIDNKWVDHIDAMDQLRRGISLRAYGNQDPVIAYKSEGHAMFEDMTAGIQHDTIRMLLKAELNAVPKNRSKLADETGTNKAPVVVKKSQSPNEPCACGSGKKYKYCCQNKDN